MDQLLIFGREANGATITMIHSSGGSEKFIKQASGSFLGDADSNFILEETIDGYMLTDREGNTETYNTGGLILSETDAAGNTISYSYNADEKLEAVTGPYGHQLSFTYSRPTSKRVETVILPDDKVLQFTIIELLGTRKGDANAVWQDGK